MAKKLTKGGGMNHASLTVVPSERTQAIIALGRILDEFRKINANMPVAQIQALLMVALDAGLGMSEISEHTGIKNSTTSRYLIELGARRLDGDGALGLVERGVDPMNTRKARYTLTAKGRRLVDAVLSILAGE